MTNDRIFPSSAEVYETAARLRISEHTAYCMLCVPPVTPEYHLPPPDWA